MSATPIFFRFMSLVLPWDRRDARGRDHRGRTVDPLVTPDPGTKPLDCPESGSGVSQFDFCHVAHGLGGPSTTSVPGPGPRGGAAPRAVPTVPPSVRSRTVVARTWSNKGTAVIPPSLALQAAGPSTLSTKSALTAKGLARTIGWIRSGCPLQTRRNFFRDDHPAQLRDHRVVPSHRRRVREVGEQHGHPRARPGSRLDRAPCSRSPSELNGTSNRRASFCDDPAPLGRWPPSPFRVRGRR
jgi:hypothetical protein